MVTASASGDPLPVAYCSLREPPDSMVDIQPDAVRFDFLSFSDFLARDLRVADATAISLCRDNALPIVVFDLLGDGNIGRAVRGEKIGTVIGPEA